MAMISLSLSVPITTRKNLSQYQLHSTAAAHVLGQKIRYKSYHAHFKTVRLLCTKLYPWETSLTEAPAGEEASIIKGSSVFESLNNEDTDDGPILENVENVIDMKSQSTVLHQALKWPMWLLGPLVLLVTGMIPTLWLPLSSVFLGANIAGVLALVGLDCIFNMGATLFLLLADACARPKSRSHAHRSRIPLTYRFWNASASLIGFVVPLLLLLASSRGFLQPHLPLISFAVLLGPYFLLLSVQMLTEMLTWHWKSPVWLVTPVVYEAYRVLQLMRGLRLGTEVGAPTWAVDTIRGLVSWWVLILGMQLMWVAWFAGYEPQAQEQS